MITHICEYTKIHQILYFKWVNCMVHELDLIKVLKKKKQQNPTELRSFQCTWELTKNFTKRSPAMHQFKKIQP